MRKLFDEVLGTATFRQYGITFLGTAITGALGALFYILAARNLGPANFGLMIVAITTLTLITDISDLGTDPGLVRFVSHNIKKNKELAYRFLKLALEVRIVVSLLVAILGWILAPAIAWAIFQKETLINPLRLAFIGVGGTLLFSFSTTTFQSLARFWSWSFIQIGTNFIRLLIIIALWYFGQINLVSGLGTYILVPFLGFLACFFFLPRGFLKVSKPYLVASEFFHYSKWIAAVSLLAAISSRLDTFIASRLLSATEIGFYGAATQLVMVVPQIVGALGTVMAPKMAGIRNKKELVNYFKKTQSFVLGLAAIGLLLSPIVIFLIPLLYGQAFAVLVPPIFLVLLLAMLVFLISIPVQTAILYYFSYPKLFIFVALGNLAIVGILGWFLISQYGTIGAAFSVLLSMLWGLIIPAIWVVGKLIKDEKSN